MSNEIQSISQSNYILHNIDAKKLYVQEPLFTANSGDAVYVGWRPDETVLWSGSASMASFTANLSEPLSSFNEMYFVCKVHPNNNFKDKVYYNVEELKSAGNQGSITLIGHAGGGGIRINNAQFGTSANTNVIYFEQQKQFNITGTTITTATVSGVITDIVGVNRKENA